LTAGTTILGLIPMVLSMNIDLLSRVVTFGAPSTQWWTQLATSIAGGLTFATVLTLLLTPCLLVLGANMNALIQRLRGKDSETIENVFIPELHKSERAKQEKLVSMD